MKYTYDFQVHKGLIYVFVNGEFYKNLPTKMSDGFYYSPAINYFYSSFMPDFNDVLNNGFYQLIKN